MVVGLTGGIGSGKTTVAKMFEELGIAIFIADKEAKLLMDSSTEIHEELIQLFGKEVINQQGKPDRKFIANKVFHNKTLLEKLNLIIHPRVAQHFENWKSHIQSAYIIYEAAIIFEKNLQNRFDYTILVTAPVSEKIKRVIARDQSTVEEVKARMKNQWSDKEKIKLANFHIENINIEATKKQIYKLHEHLLSLVNT